MRLDAVAKAKEDALAFSQQTLEEDAKKFEDYLQELVMVKLTNQFKISSWAKQLRFA